MHHGHFKRQSLALFFIVSVVPALVVAALWYLSTQQTGTGPEIGFASFVLPVIALGVVPAILLSLVFAELLSRPVRRIHQAALELARGPRGTWHKSGVHGEFHEIGEALDAARIRLDDILSQATAEQAVIASERNKLRGVLNAMTDGVFALDTAGRIILFNHAASNLTGRTIESVAGQLAEKVMPFRANGEIVLTRWLATHRGTDHEIGRWRNLELYTASGASLIVDVQAVVLPADPNGISALITFHDLTPGADLERMKVDFVALAAHELRTPITELRGYLDLLQHELKDLSPIHQRFLSDSVGSASHLSGLVSNLLGVARIEHGDLGYAPAPLNYLALMRTVGESLRAQLAPARRRLILKLPRTLPAVQADATGLTEVLSNLVENAAHVTAPETGRITITVRHHQGEIETTVSDNGTGIPSYALPHLFTKFYRADTMTASHRGTGLGLYICKAIIEAHGGHIWAESNEGKGSSFSFRLPLAHHAGSSRVEHNTANHPGGAHGWIKPHSLH